ncbi:MAG: hydrogenase maturation nickel metallochaperone HypA, partial [Chloroflexota bacterium]
MHELSIAYSLVNTAEAAARDAGVTAVSRVYLQLGAISGVVHDALLFSYDI